MIFPFSSRAVSRVNVVCMALALCAMTGMMPRVVADDSDCFLCHGDKEFNVTKSDGTVVPLYVNEEDYKKTVHADEGCTSCHADATPDHDPGLAKVDCGTCHDESKAFANSPHGHLAETGGAEFRGCIECHGKHDIVAASAPESPVSKVNQPKTCGRCHSDPEMAKKYFIPVAHPAQEYQKSAHAQAIAKGNLNAAVCSDCHGAHEVLPLDDPASKIARKNIQNTCGACHKQPLEDYVQSIHGQAVEAGLKYAPTCVDCHGEHDIEGKDQASSKISSRQQVVATCTRCHDDETIMGRFGIMTGRQASYMDSYHGLASASGSEIVATCASCHENHRILPQANPNSSIALANLPATCGKCHKDAGPNFATGKVHIAPSAPDQWMLGLVRLAYILLITAIIGGMVFHNTLSMIRKATKKFQEEMSDQGTYRRFSRGMTIGHLLLTVSFIALAVSGFALRYPDTWWATLLFHGDKGLMARGIIHRAAALVLVGIAVANFCYLVFTKAGRRELWMLMMGIRDLRDIFLNLAYMVGLRKEPPKFDRYSYIEKFEYWGMWWGTLLMIFTGFSMWFVNVFLQFLPKVALDVIALIHFYEAWLAVLTIVVWHLYYMIFDPQTYPMNWSWITGRITMDDLKERHPLEYQREFLEKEEKETE